MAWTTPKTWAAGELVTETVLNEHIRDNIDILKLAFTDAGKLRALSSSYVDDLDGSALTGVSKTAGDNSFTGENDFSAGAGTRFVLPVGADLWAT